MSFGLHLWNNRQTSYKDLEIKEKLQNTTEKYNRRRKGVYHIFSILVD